MPLARSAYTKRESFNCACWRGIKVLPMSDRISYPPVAAEQQIAEARRISVREVRQRAYEMETRVDGGVLETRSSSDDERHQRDLARASRLREQFASEPVKPVSQRSAAINRAATADEVRELNSWLAAPQQAEAYEARSASETTGSAGGYLLPLRFNAALIHQLREYDSFLKNFELWESADGEVYTRPVYSQFGSAVAQTENATFTDGPYPVLTNQAWSLASTYASSFTASYQLVQDALFESKNRVGGGGGFNTDNSGAPQNRTLDEWVSGALGESLGRVIAPTASAALYAGITAVGATSGQNGGYVTLAAATPVNYITGSASTELIQNTINIDTAALMLAALDAAYVPGAAWYFSSQQWTNLIRQVDSNKHLQIDPGLGLKLFDLPVILTSQTLSAAASTTSGPVLANMAAAMTLRVVDGSMFLLRSGEKYAELLQMYYRASLRAGVAVRDARAMVGVRYAAT
jgi:hypothetical protein